MKIVKKMPKSFDLFSLSQARSVATVNRIIGRKYSTGLSLVELMVAMVIGLISVVVMMQMFSVSEAQKRTTVSGDNALTSGFIALNSLQRDIQQSGWGFSRVSVLGCNLTGLSPATTPVVLTPVTIRPGIDANTDSLMIVTGNGNGTVEGALIEDQTANTYAIQGSESFAATERVFAFPPTRPTTCSLSLTSVNSISRPNVTVGAGVANVAGGRLYSMGLAPSVRIYAIRAGTLVVCDHVANDCGADTSTMTAAQVSNLWVPVAENIVSMRVLYGKDAGTTWDQTVRTPTTSPPVSSDPLKNTQACGLLQISALRLVLVARSSQPEKTLDWPALTQHVTATQPTWGGSAVAAITTPNPSAATWPTWQDFRYKVFETVVPLRNISTLGVVPEC